MYGPTVSALHDMYKTDQTPGHLEEQYDLQQALLSGEFMHNFDGSPALSSDSPCFDIERDELDQLNILLVEPDLAKGLQRTKFLEESKYTVLSVSDVRGIFQHRGTIKLSMAVLSDLLGQFALRASAESVRRQWPGARILVLGHASSILEDHLYDDTLGQHYRSDELLAKLRAHSGGNADDRRLNSSAYSSQAAAWAPTAKLALVESNPAKIRLDGALQKHVSRDEPAGIRRTSIAG
jgi:hypothetical protein